MCVCGAAEGPGVRRRGFACPAQAWIFSAPGDGGVLASFAAESAALDNTKKDPKHNLTKRGRPARGFLS